MVYTLSVFISVTEECFNAAPRTQVYTGFVLPLLDSCCLLTLKGKCLVIGDSCLRSLHISLITIHISLIASHIYYKILTERKLITTHIPDHYTQLLHKYLLNVNRSQQISPITTHIAPTTTHITHMH